jgi:cytochrome c
VWGAVNMPAHPQLSETQASQIVAYILSIGEERKATPSLATRGAYTPPDSAKQGVIVLQAAYTDRGANGVPAVSASKAVVLRAPTVVVAKGEVDDGVQKYAGPEVPVEITIGSRNGGHVGFKQIDLTGVSAIVFSAMAPVPQLNAAGGKVEVRADSATGVLLGETEVIQPAAAFGAPTQLRASLTPTAGARRLLRLPESGGCAGAQPLHPDDGDIRARGHFTLMGMSSV